MSWIEELTLEPLSTRFENFGNGVFAKIPNGAIFAYFNGKYVYDPLLRHPEAKIWWLKDERGYGLHWTAICKYRFTTG